MRIECLHLQKGWYRGSISHQRSNYVGFCWFQEGVFCVYVYETTYLYKIKTSAYQVPDQVLVFILDIYVVFIKHIQKYTLLKPTKSYIIESLMRDRPPMPPLLEMKVFDTHLFRWV